MNWPDHQLITSLNPLWDESVLSISLLCQATSDCRLLSISFVCSNLSVRPAAAMNILSTCLVYC